jgi:hypothetical protein
VMSSVKARLNISLSVNRRLDVLLLLLKTILPLPEDVPTSAGSQLDQSIIVALGCVMLKILQTSGESHLAISEKLFHVYGDAVYPDRTIFNFAS